MALRSASGPGLVLGRAPGSALVLAVELVLRRARGSALASASAVESVLVLVLVLAVESVPALVSVPKPGSRSMSSPVS